MRKLSRIWPDSSRVGLSTSTRQVLRPGCRRIGREMMENRQREGGGFSRPGLGNSDHVAAGHDDRNGLHLDRGRCEVFFLCECTRDWVVEIEVLKGGQRRSFPVCAAA